MSDTVGLDKAGLQLHLSRLLLGSLIAGVASTVAVAIFGALAARPRPAGPLTGNPPPPEAMPGLVVSVGLFVVAWVAVLVTIARDQILRRLATLETGLRAFADEYGEQRDTDGYLRALRTAGLPAPAAGEVRQLHRVPPPTGPAE